MVGVSAGLADYFDGLIHGKGLVLHQDTDHLRNDHSRMGIIDLHHCMVVELTKVIQTRLHLSEDQLRCIADHEIFLINTKEIACLVGIIRIKEQGQILLNVFLIEINAFLYKGLIHALYIE